MKRKCKVIAVIVTLSMLVAALASIQVGATTGNADIPAGIRFNDADVYDESFFEENAMQPLPDSGLDSLPPMVDLSQSQYFPPIGNQGSLNSCAAFATTYYQYTYEKNKLQNTVATTSANWASPKFTYNFMNGGVDGGLITTDVYPFLQQFGAPSWEDFPYVGNRDSVDNYTQWPSEASVYREAAIVTAQDWETTSINCLGNNKTPITSAWDPDLNQVKGLLNNGKVLVVSTSFHWLTKNVRNSGEIIAYATQGSGSGHSMAVVGYNDTISCDVNGNGIIEQGEQGAFKLANSWGTGYANDGYIWVLYDALNWVSSIPNNTVPDRRSIFSGAGYFSQNLNGFTFLILEEDHSCIFYEVSLNNQIKNHIQLASKMMKQDPYAYVHSWLGPDKKGIGRGGNQRFTGKIAIKRSYASYTDINRTVYVNIANNSPAGSDPFEVQSLKITDEYGETMCGYYRTPFSVPSSSSVTKNFLMADIQPGSGDIDYDGEITRADWVAVSYYIKGKQPLSELQLIMADANGDGKITSADVQKIASWAAEYK